MRILTVEEYKGATMCIIFENKKRIYLNKSIVSEMGLRSGIDIDEKKLTEISDAAMKRKARERALHLLDFKDYSYCEMLEKLLKNYDEDLCYETVDTLAKQGLINDKRYAQSMAQRLFCGNGYGMYRVKRQLQQKGVCDELIEPIISEYADGEKERIRAIIERKYSDKLDEYPDRQKVKAALVRLGFSFDDINEVISEYSK